ncbi:hypothetical protein [Bradyrhizobium sp. 930_D9_N1_4]|uniref:hypothetical protein n=1 Tax=Bradyrhizobium sp. 930_D9_N1_4 TaxID=3240374 RepID=UPI003F8A0695
MMFRMMIAATLLAATTAGPAMAYTHAPSLSSMVAKKATPPAPKPAAAPKPPAPAPGKKP